MTITLTGATGFLGKRLQQHLREAGHTLHILARKVQPDQPGTRYFSWIAEQGLPPAEALDRADSVIHLAGAPVAQRWTATAKHRIRTSRIEGTRHLVQALTTQTRRPATLVSASAIGYYGSRGDTVLTESSKPGQDFLAEVCREWEQQAELAAALGLRVVLIRIGVVLGPDGGALAQMLPPFRLGVGGPIAGGRQWMSWIHISDLIAIITAAATESRWHGPVNAVAPQPVTNREFTQALGEALHRPAVVPVPGFALKMLYGEMSSVILGSQRVLPKAAISAGFPYGFPQLQTALQDILAAPMVK